MHVRARGLLLVLAVVVATGTGPARADDEGPVSAEKRRRASQLVRRGDRHKQAGEYAEAVRAYEQAYELVPHPELFFNLGQVHRLAGDLRRALEYYEGYLAVAPNGRAAAQAGRFAGQLREQLGVAPPSRPARPPRPTQPTTGRVFGGGRTPAGGGARPGGRVPGGRVGGRAGSTVGPERPAPPAEHDEVSAGRGLRVTGLVSAGVGVLALGLAAKFGVDARTISDEIDAHRLGPWPETLLDRQEQGQLAERRMFVLGAVGAVAVVGGGVLYYLGHRAGRAAERQVTVVATPIATADLVGVAVDARF